MTNQFELHWLQLPKEATEFFAYFSRFEFALKQSGYLNSTSSENNAEAKWPDFANDLSKAAPTFFDEIKRAGKAAVLIDKPPEIQKGDLSWRPWGSDPRKKLEKSAEFFCAICRVRNNLFHGGKSSSLGSDPERDIALLNACLFVLKKALEKCCAQKNDKLRTVYDEFTAPPNPPLSGLEPP